MTSACADRSTATATGVRGGLKVSLICSIKIPNPIVPLLICIFIIFASTDAHMNTNDTNEHRIDRVWKGNSAKLT